MDIFYRSCTNVTNAQRKTGEFSLRFFIVLQLKGGEAIYFKRFSRLIRIQLSAPWVSQCLGHGPRKGDSAATTLALELDDALQVLIPKSDETQRRESTSALHPNGGAAFCVGARANPLLPDKVAKRAAHNMGAPRASIFSLHARVRGRSLASAADIDSLSAHELHRPDGRRFAKSGAARTRRQCSILKHVAVPGDILSRGQLPFPALIRREVRADWLETGANALSLSFESPPFVFGPRGKNLTGTSRATLDGLPA